MVCVICSLEFNLSGCKKVEYPAYTPPPQQLQLYYSCTIIVNVFTVCVLLLQIFVYCTTWIIVLYLYNSLQVHIVDSMVGYSILVIYKVYTIIERDYFVV